MPRRRGRPRDAARRGRRRRPPVRSRSRPARRSAATRCSRTRSRTSSRSPGVVETLELASIPPLRDERDDHHPLVIAGGPLTFSNPAPLAPFCDVIIIGEGEELIVELVDARARGRVPAQRAVGPARGQRPGYYLPHRTARRVPPVAAVDDELLPARSVIATPHTELADMFMTEAARGCSRGCTYCVMRRSTNGGMRIVDRATTIIAGIPEPTRAGSAWSARRSPITRTSRRSSARRRRRPRGRHLEPARRQARPTSWSALLARGGYRTLTVAADGASERMRRVVERSTQARHLLRSAELARDAPATHAQGLHDARRARARPTRTSTSSSSFEGARRDPSARRVRARAVRGQAQHAARRHAVRRDRRRRSAARTAARGPQARRPRGKVEVRPTSARWAWVEYMIAQGETRRRARDHGRPPRRRQLRRLQAGVRGARGRADGAARPGPVQPGADRAQEEAARGDRLIDGDGRGQRRFQVRTTGRVVDEILNVRGASLPSAKVRRATCAT